jgi:hypothetical protein
MNKVGLEQTRIYFYPKSNLSNIRVMVGSGTITQLEANQAFNIKLTVNKRFSIKGGRRVGAEIVETLNKHDI